MIVNGINWLYEYMVEYDSVCFSFVWTIKYKMYNGTQREKTLLLNVNENLFLLDA